VLAPDYQQARLVHLHPCLPLRIIFDILAVVVEQIALNLCLSRRIKKCELVGPFSRSIIESHGGRQWAVLAHSILASSICCPGARPIGKSVRIG
jgi:hypothetical protein